MTEHKKAAGYVRVSTTAQVHEGESLQTQRDSIAAYCKAYGLDLVTIYADEGISGASTEKRPEFLQLLKDAKTGKFACLVVCSLSRFGRNARELLNNYDELEDHGVKLVFLKESIDTSTPYGRLLRTVMAAFSELERDMILERTSENRIAKWKRGGTFVGKVPYGYVWNKEKKRMEINPVEAKVYRHIVELYLHEGLGDLNIALRLKDEGVKFRGRKYPATQTIAYMLKNPVYYGNYVVNRYEYKGDRRTGKMKPEAEHITIEVPPLISKTKWDEIKKKRTFNKSKAKRVTFAKDYFLRDLLVCGECGGKILSVTHSRARKDETFPRYYSCYHHKTTAKRLEVSERTRCKLPFINADEIEAMVWDDMINLLTYGGFEALGQYHPSKLEELIGTAKYDEKIADLETALQTQESELKGKVRAKERVMALLEGDDYEPADFRQKLAKINEEIFTIKASIEDGQVKIGELREAKANNEAFVDFAKNNQGWLAGLREELNNLSPEDKKIFLESLIPGKISIIRELEGDKWTWFMMPTYPFAFNQVIFDRLIAEGKLNGLNKNSRDYFYLINALSLLGRAA